MKRKLPKALVVFVDSREKYPIVFPKVIKWWGHGTHGGPLLCPVKVVKCRLPAGDYVLRYNSRACIVERKASLDELVKNLFTDDWPRMNRALQKLAKACRFPVLLVEAGLGDLLRYKFNSFEQAAQRPCPEAVQDKLMRVCTYYGIELWLIGGGRRVQTRTALGSLVLRLMLARAYGRRWDDDKEQLIRKYGPQKNVKNLPRQRRGDILHRVYNATETKTSRLRHSSRTADADSPATQRGS